MIFSPVIVHQGSTEMSKFWTRARLDFFIAATCCVFIPIAPIVNYLVNAGLLSSRSDIDLKQWMGQLPPHLTSRLGSSTLAKHLYSQLVSKRADTDIILNITLASAPETLAIYVGLHVGPTWVFFVCFLTSEIKKWVDDPNIVRF